MMDTFSGADKPNPRNARGEPKAVSSEPANIADGIGPFSVGFTMAGWPPSMREPGSGSCPAGSWPAGSWPAARAQPFLPPEVVGPVFMAEVDCKRLQIRHASVG